MSTVEVPGRATVRSTREILADTRRAIDPIIYESVGDLEPELAGMARYHFGWCDKTARQPITAPGAGKGVRPALTLLCADAIDADDPMAVQVAVAVELVHNFSLIHDDVMDRDRERRHRPTLWAKFGISNAILVGDALLALAFKALVATNNPTIATAGTRELGQAVITLCEGQRRDIEFEKIDVVPVAECLTMITDKTAALMRCACVLGGIAVSASDAQIVALRRFGEHIGNAFQLVDDYLGIWGESSVTGKAVGNDLIRKKKSLPVAVAMAGSNGSAAELAELYGRPGPLPPADLARAREIIETTGAREWVRQRVLAESHSALECVRILDGAAPATHEMAALTESLAVRVY